MANMIHFFDAAEGAEVLSAVSSMELPAFRAAFPGIAGKRRDSFSFFVGRTASGEVRPVTRVVEIKANPSRHECDARCLGASGRSMRCECKCNGKNHGRGALVCA
jgi:hypothetical protein